jgi:hypothetical protein
MTIAKEAMRVGMAVAVLAGGTAWAQSPAEIAAARGTPVVVSANVALEATDNRDAAPSGAKTSSVDVLLTPRIDLIRMGERGSFELFYAPSLRWRSDPAPWQDETDVYHTIGLDAWHALNERLRVRIDNRYDFTEQPMIEDDGTRLRGDRSYWQNRTVAAVNYYLLHASNADLAGEYRIRRYDDDATARNHDETERSVALALRHQMTETLRLLGLGKFVQYGYEKTDLDRDFDSTILAVGFEKVLAETLRASLLTGWQGRSYSDDTQTSDGLPYVRARLQGSMGRLRLTGEIEHGVRSADVTPFSSQEYVDVGGTVVVEVSGKLEVVGKAIYRTSSYDADQTPSGTVAADFHTGEARSGDRTTRILEGGLNYRATESLRLTVRQRFEDVDSDIDASYNMNTTRLALTAWF